MRVTRLKELKQKIHSNWSDKKLSWDNTHLCLANWIQRLQNVSIEWRNSFKMYLRPVENEIKIEQVHISIKLHPWSFGCPEILPEFIRHFFWRSILINLSCAMLPTKPSNRQVLWRWRCKVSHQATEWEAPRATGWKLQSLYFRFNAIATRNILGGLLPPTMTWQTNMYLHS